MTFLSKHTLGQVCQLVLDGPEISVMHAPIDMRGLLFLLLFVCFFFQIDKLSIPSWESGVNR